MPLSTVAVALPTDGSHNPFAVLAIDAARCANGIGGIEERMEGWDVGERRKAKEAFL